MKAEVICFASAKGGSGKTVLTASIASFLSGIGKKCLIIDCDAATHGMTLLYLSEVSKNKSKSKTGFFELSRKRIQDTILKDIIVKIENSIDFLPATYNFTLGYDPEELFEENALESTIEAFKSRYDYIFLDAQAGSDKYSRLAMREDISDKVVIVSEYDPLSSAGIERLKQVIGKDLDYTRTWILLNKMLPEFVDKFSEFLSVAKYLPPIPWNADIVRAYAKRNLAIDLESGNVFTLAILRTVQELFGEELDEEINEWKKEKTFALREPLVKQYEQVENELKSFFELRNERTLKNNKIQFRNEFSLKLSFAMFGLTIFVGISSILKNNNSSFVEMIINMDYKMVSLIVIITALSVPIAFILKEALMKVSNKSLKELEDKKLNIKINFLEKKLEQLEAMRSADLESILKKED